MMVVLRLLALLSILAACRAYRIALIVVDMQRCFTRGGTLEMTDGREVVQTINDIRTKFGRQFDLVVNTQDWHCRNDVSFASAHPGYKVLDTITLTYDADGNLCRRGGVTAPYSVDCSQKSAASLTHMAQTLWPDHCVINTTDADFHPLLITKDTDVYIKKGQYCQVDSYSAFYDNGGFTSTKLDDVLKENKIDTLFITGVAAEYCVYWTALDANKLGYAAYVVEDATRGIDDKDIAKAVKDMVGKGIQVINSSQVSTALDKLSSGQQGLTTHITSLISLLILTWLPCFVVWTKWNL